MSRAVGALALLTLGHASRASYDFLNQWLRSLDITIPETTHRVRVLGNVTFRGHCTDLSLEDIDTDKDGTHMKLAIDGLGLHCKLRTSSLVGEVDVEFEIGEKNGKKSQLDLGMDFHSDGEDVPFPMYVKAPPSECTARVEMAKRMNFTGSVAAEILEWTVRPILGELLSQSWLLCTFIEGAVDIGSKGLLSKLDEGFRDAQAAGEPPLPEPISPADKHGDIVDIEHNPIMPFLDKFFGTLMNSSSDQCLNKLLPSSLLVPAGLSLPLSLGHMGDLKLTLHWLSMSGLNTWSDLALNSSDEHGLHFSLGMDEIALNVSLRIELTPGDSSEAQFDPLAEDFKLSFAMSKFAFGTDLYMLLNATTWGNYKFLELLQAGTLISGIDDARLLTLNLFKQQLPAINFQLQPSAGSSGEVLEEGLDRTVNAFATLVLGDFGGALGTYLRHEMGTTVRDKGNAAIMDTLSNVPTWTPAPFIFDSELLHNLGFIMAAALAGASLVIMVAVRTKTKATKGEEVPEGLGGPPSGALEASLTGEPAGEDQGWSLATHPRIPMRTRIGLPLMIFATASLFISANAGVGIEINMAVSAEGGSVVNPPSVFPETLLRNVIDMAKAGDWLFAVFIGFYSSVWPYTKLTMMMLCWFLPVRRLSLHKRSFMLEFLDALGKWSLVDTYISVMFMVAFDIRLSCQGAAPYIADICVAAGTDAAFRVYVEPTLGLHFLLIGTLMSLAAGLWMSASHRYAEQIGEHGPAQDYDFAECLGNKRRLCLLLQGETKLSHIMYQWCVPIAFIVSLVLCVVGSFMYTFRFEFTGVAAWLFGDNAVTDLSLVSMAVDLPGHSIDPKSFGVHWLEIFFLVFSGMTVLALLCVLLVLWMLPMTVKQHRSCLVVAQAINSVAGLDVFVITVLVSTLQLQSYADFILDELHLGGINDQLNNIIPHIPFIANNIPGDDYQIAVKSSLLPGFGLLFSACLVSTVLGLVIMRKCSKALFDTEHRPLAESFAAAGSAVFASQQHSGLA